MPMIAEVHLAHDGSLNGDWVARYAVRLAAASSSRRLHVVHVAAGGGAGELDASLGRIAASCDLEGVALRTTQVPGARKVAAALVETVPARRDVLLVCGVRRRDMGRGLLAGTVSARLLRSARHNVLAVRAVHPASLGAPRRLALPLSGNPQTVGRMLPLLRLLSSSLHEVVCFRTMTVGRFRFRHLTPVGGARLEGEGRAFLRAQAALLREELGSHGPRVDLHVTVSDDWPKEIVLAASRFSADLVLLGATERSLPGRVFLGNPLEQILHRCPCDVAIHRAGSFEEP
jgi:nucleotide-binding universal stress UspA family protein